MCCCSISDVFSNSPETIALSGSITACELCLLFSLLYWHCNSHLLVWLTAWSRTLLVKVLNLAAHNICACGSFEYSTIPCTSTLVVTISQDGTGQSHPAYKANADGNLLQKLRDSQWTLYYTYCSGVNRGVQKLQHIYPILKLLLSCAKIINLIQYL